MAPEQTPIENVPEAVAGVQAAVNYLNAHGGIQGHKIAVDYCNPQVDPNVEEACARTAKSNGDIALVGAVQYVGTALWPILENEQIPSIGETPVAAIDYQAPINFPFDNGSILAFASDAVVLAHLGAARVATGTLQVAAGIDNANGTKALISQGHLTTPSGKPMVFAGEAMVTETESNFQPSAETVQSLNVDAVIDELGPQQAIQLMTAVKQLGLTPTWAANSSSFSSTDMKTAASLLEGMYVVGNLPPVSAVGSFPGIAEFVKEMAAAKAAGVTDAGTLDNASLISWLSVYALQAAADTIKGPITNTSLLAALKTLPDQKLKGIVTWRPSKTGPLPGYPRATNSDYYVMKIHDGSLQLLSPQPFDSFAALSGQKITIPGLSS